MANQLKVAVVHTIEVLLERGWSQRRVAGALGVDRGTVARYARRAREPANPAKAPPGSEGAPTKPAVFHLPPYSPDFNPDEQVWSHLKHQELKSHQAVTRKQLKGLARRRLKSMANCNRSRHSARCS